MLNQTLLLVVTLGLLLCFLSRRRLESLARALGRGYAAIRSWSAARPDGRDERLVHLEEMVRTAELTNHTFLRSLELVQRNIETVILRAESTEQRLMTLLTQTGCGKADQYSSAALLLSEGKAPEQVAGMLGLPVHQVELVQELRRAVQRDNKSRAHKASTILAGQKRLEERSAAAARKRPTFPAHVAKGHNGAAQREKTAALSR
jgi:hypothetical protein